MYKDFNKTANTPKLSYFKNSQDFDFFFFYKINIEDNTNKNIVRVDEYLEVLTYHHNNICKVSHLH